MSIPKKATWKERTLTAHQHNRLNSPPGNSRTLANRISKSAPQETFDRGSTPQDITTDAEHKDEPKPLGTNGRQRSAAKSAAGETLSDRKHRMKDARDMVTGEDTHQSEATDKAALRQAKSERRSKKRRKSDVAVNTTNIQSDPIIELSVPARDGLTQQDEKLAHTPQNDHSNNQSKPNSKQRFIVFIGNLPYNATTSAIQSHFSKLKPFTVRYSTDKETGRSRGFAFLEFESYDKMKTCLKLFHHSLFDASAGQTPSRHEEGKRSQARKINVELTAGGGGGKSAARKEKIKEKNEKLEGERERTRVHKEKEEAAAIRKKKRKAGDMTGANAIQVMDGAAENENIHPSRRKRVET
jgi:nucleolar protein 6